jgi:hypothetical protein
MTLGDVTAVHDQATVGEALAMLGMGDILRWEGELHQVRGDGGRVPVEIAMATVGGHSSGELVMLLQETDVSARKRLEGLRDGLVAVRHTIVSANSWEQAAPQLLSGLCAHLDWDLAQYWAVDGDLQALRLRHAWHRDGVALEDFHNQSRRLSIETGVGLLGRVWRSGVPSAQEDLSSATDYDRAPEALRAQLRSAIAFPVLNSGVVIGVIEMLAGEPRRIENDRSRCCRPQAARSGVHSPLGDRPGPAPQRDGSPGDLRAIPDRDRTCQREGELPEANPALLHMTEHDFQTMRSQRGRTCCGHTTRPPRGHGWSRCWPVSPTARACRSARGPAAQVAVAAAHRDDDPDSSGRPEHVLVMVEDVTIVREAQDKLGEALESQRSANATLRS